MQIRTISSALTFFLKFVFPVMLIYDLPYFWLADNVYFWADNNCPMAHLGTARLWLVIMQGQCSTIWPPSWLGIILFLIPAGFLWLFSGIKRVRRDDKYLYVSNYFREISTPLSNIINVEQNFLLSQFRLPLTKIFFEDDAEFGDEISFIPRGLFFPLRIPCPLPIVDELKNLGTKSVDNEPEKN